MNVSRRWFLGSALALSACSSGAVPRDTFYRLGALAAPQALVGGPIKGTVEIPPFRAQGIVNERAVLYRESARELAQYNYHTWIEPASQMASRAFIEALRAAQAFTAVASPEMRQNRDYELLGDVREWEHVLPQAGGPAAAIAIDISLRRTGDNREMIVKSYRVNEPVAGDTIDAVVQGFTTGLDKIIAQVLGDLAQLPKTR